MPKSGDYYDDVAQESVGLQWNQFPVKVFEDSPPGEWQRTTQKAIDDLQEIFPLQLVTTRDRADIVLGWNKLPKNSDGSQPAGVEHDVMEVVKENGEVVRRSKRSFITLDISRRWSKDEMRATVVHEMGHALGIKGHSSNHKDMMFPEEVEIVTESKAPQDLSHPDMVAPSSVDVRSWVSTKISQRDINTLIRLYNRAGPLRLLR